MPDSEEFLDPYLDPQTGVLRNLIGARTKQSLDDAEGSLSFARLVQLMDRPPKPTRDLTELRAIHRHLFQDLYDWAGQPRTVDIRKNVEGAEFFLPSAMIERASVFAASELHSDNALRGLDRGHFIDRLAYHYDQVNSLTLRDRVGNAGKRSGEATGELRQFTASVISVAEAEETLEAAEDRLRRVKQLEETLDLTRLFLEEAQNQVRRDIAPVIKATLRESLPSIMAGRYTDVTVNPSTLQIEVCGPSRRWRRAELLSHGTAEQIYLLLRIALADHLTKAHDTCPLILDDVTVHADAVRKDEILLLRVAERRQVIIFTQEQQVAEWARKHLSGPGHAIRTLPTVMAT
jgi:hypothetical protein